MNRDASLNFAEHADDALFPHASSGLDGSADSADQLRAWHRAAPPWRSLGNKHGLGHTACRPELGCCNMRRRKASPKKNPSNQRRTVSGGLDQESVRYCPCNRAAHGSGHGVGFTGKF